MKRVIFRLSMPNRGSSNSCWSGEGRELFVVRRLSQKQIVALNLPRSWFYHWEDGWRANVAVDVVPLRKKLPESDGFEDYDWMVDSIIAHGCIEKPKPKDTP